ncbi:hypothetical protein [Prauserella cavernicola]|uniref:Uncharacterized protein n=1 Tax=Prauserella cavernicola TaxID=2800127 RepID=A0A934V6H2_9PSEU|nr:hypothetical protein [Prauserella cavernicola]MBK1786205.1 hypothetical protein [Prauserella cavernicola]
MSIATEPETMAELIADCAEIPRPEIPGTEPVAAAEPWRVDDACHAQVADLDEYV